MDQMHGILSHGTHTHGPCAHAYGSHAHGSHTRVTNQSLQCLTNPAAAPPLHPHTIGRRQGAGATVLVDGGAPDDDGARVVEEVLLPTHVTALDGSD